MKARSDALLTWYRDNRRDLPWRDVEDPYRILVSEVMLQQTRADRVVAYYVDFVERFPTVETLARAPAAAVLAAWSGLGYNRRALRLREAARLIAEGGWPESVSGLLALPGVGPYTAHAVASFAFGCRVPAPDTNARRVLSRWHGRVLGERELWETATAELPAEAAAWNQAVMDLGATLCRPREPRCHRCPVARWCTDPTVYRPPPRQPRFEGSLRQARGAVIRTLLEVPKASPAQIAALNDADESRMVQAVEALIGEGVVTYLDDGCVALAGGSAAVE